ncbi:fused MFS/spermidine synthase [Myxococcaceae bacterium JPH2]|nr:fused MFS/spermidine synthase [Myxococcaceae bacterium JPH2]
MLRYALAIFASAFLLFGVQPLAGRYALPWYGGTSSVWTACMLFFQVALLAGYAYAHAVSSRLPSRAQAKLHLGVLALAVAGLVARALITGSPLAPGPEWRPQPDGVPVLRLVAMLAVTLGPPFFVLSTTGPLLQSWFARAHPGRSPYGLYALSNAGSLLALLGYPLLVEPWVARGTQTWGWSAGFVAFTLACAACALDVARRHESPSEPTTATTPESDAPRPGLLRTLGWLGLSACASVLLLATTNQLSQDVAAGPVLWVLPLAVYLLTFILAFAREALYARGVYAVLLIIGVAMMAVAQTSGPGFGLLPRILCYAGTLFAGAMVCHGELYRLRPAPRHLGAFYLWVSLGGVLGSLFVSLWAPAFFRAYWEYPLSLAACCAVALGGRMRQPATESRPARAWRVVGGALLVLLPLNLTLIGMGEYRRMSLSTRNFFGVVQVLEQGQGQPDVHRYTLRHGAIAHGWQFIQEDKRREPTAYYTRETGLGLAIAEQRRRREAQGLSPGLRVGVLGLGVGTSAALMSSADRLRFYEINPVIIALAKGEHGFFHYLSDTQARVDVVEGDARISLEQELERGEPQSFDVLALDVFSSDAIPIHLLTEEAMALYLRHLAPHGVMALHISNQYLDLVPVTLAHARAFGLHATHVFNESTSDAPSSRWMVLSPDADFTSGLAFQRSTSSVRRMSLRGPPDFTWTDELGSVVRAVRWWPQSRTTASQSVVVEAAGASVTSPEPP